MYATHSVIGQYPYRIKVYKINKRSAWLDNTRACRIRVYKITSALRWAYQNPFTSFKNCVKLVIEHIARYDEYAKLQTFTIVEYLNTEICMLHANRQYILNWSKRKVDIKKLILLDHTTSFLHSYPLHFQLTTSHHSGPRIPSVLGSPSKRLSGRLVL